MSAEEGTPGVVYGYLCFGRTPEGRKVYRFGKSKRLLHDAEFSEDKEVAIERIGCRGLNRPEEVMFWIETSSIECTWDNLLGILRNHYRIDTETPRPKVEHRNQIGDKYFTLACETTTENFGKYLHEAAINVDPGL